MLPVSLLTLGSAFAHPVLSERGAMVVEAARRSLSMETVCERERLTLRRSCRSIVRRDPRLCPSAHARPKQERERCRYTQLASAAKALDPLVDGFRPDYSYRCGKFFFSSRRRHTRFKCDWSSDVCSSDLHFSPIYG